MPVTSFHSPRVTVALYAAFLAVLVALLPLDGAVRQGEAATALALQAPVLATLLLGRRPQPLRPGVAYAGIALFLASVALLRDAADTSYGPLVLLPVIWAALRGRRGELVISIGGGALVYVVPLVVVGPPQYPAMGWRICVLMGLVAIVIGVAVLRLVERLRAHDDAMRNRANELSAIAAVTRAVSHSDADDARRTICDVAVGVTGAIRAGLWEADEDGLLHNTCNVGSDPSPFPVGHDQPRNGSRLAMATGRPLFVPVAAGSPHVDQRILRALSGPDPDVSMAFRPIRGADGVRGVLVLAWTPAIPEPPAQAEPVLDVLAVEAAAAMQRADLLQRLAELSRTDDLTGLPNRRAWEELLDRELRVARRTGQPLSVVMLDLDFFKAYNDHHGHQGGDRLLWLAGQLWRENLRDTDVLARWGGEEFGLLLPGCNADCARRLVERLHALPLDGVTFSAGIAEWDGVCTADALLGQSDAALYAAKRAGRNRTHTAPVYTAAA